MKKTYHMWKMIIQSLRSSFPQLLTLFSSIYIRIKERKFLRSMQECTNLYGYVGFKFFSWYYSTYFVLNGEIWKISDSTSQCQIDKVSCERMALVTACLFIKGRPGVRLSCTAHLLKSFDNYLHVIDHWEWCYSQW